VTLFEIGKMKIHANLSKISPIIKE